MTNYKNKLNVNKSGICNKEDHKQWNRRSFLQALGLLGGGAMTYANSSLSASKLTPLTSAIGNSETDRVLILIELKGGNDGLNNIVPLYDYDVYANSRPGIRIKQNEMINLNDNFGISSYATKYEEMWGDGKMKVAHGVGYPNPSLSHFTGEDNWASADPTNFQPDSGWLGRYLENIYPDYDANPPSKPAAIQIGNSSNLTLSGREAYYGFSVGSPDRLQDIAQNGLLYSTNNLPPCIYGEQKGFLRTLVNSTYNYAEVINQAFISSSNYGDYPNNDLAKQLSVISRMIKGNLGTKIYLVQLRGFDTHVNQLNRQRALIQDLSESVSHFYNDLETAGWDDKVLCMTTSEFGRRVNQNGSGGTDHGTASQSIFFGPALNGNGFVGTHPDLSDLDSSGNLKYTTDFRQLYASVLKDWLCVNSGLIDEVLLDGGFSSVDLGFECSQLSTDDTFLEANGFNHYVEYIDDNPNLHIKMSNTGHVDIRLYNFLGQEVGSLKNEILFAGEHTINVNKTIGKQLAEGQYIYRIVTSRHSYSKSLVIK